MTKQAQVIVVGVIDGQVTKDGSGVQRFDSFDQARAVFPDLKIEEHGERFTRALGQLDGVIRFEAWPAVNILSS